jgi:hypothetical protein
MFLKIRLLSRSRRRARVGRAREPAVNLADARHRPPAASKLCGVSISTSPTASALMRRLRYRSPSS